MSTTTYALRLAAITFDVAEQPAEVTMVGSQGLVEWIAGQGHDIYDRSELAGVPEWDEPTDVRFTISIDTAARLAVLGNKGRPVDPTYPFTHPLYDCLGGGVFNRYWDNGVAEFVSDQGKDWTP